MMNSIQLLGSMCLVLISLSSPQNNPQDTLSISYLDFLRSSSSPAVILLELSPELIEKPTSPTTVSTHILPSLEKMSLSPKGYTITFSPYWMRHGDSVGYNDYINPHILPTFLQTATISLATATESDTADSSNALLAAGAGSFSLARGHLDPEYTKLLKQLDRLYSISLNLQSHIKDSLRSNDHEYTDSLKALNQNPTESLRAFISQKERYFVAKAESLAQAQLPVIHEQIAQMASKLQFRRLGWKLDFKGGVALKLPQEGTQIMQVTRWSTWTIGGYDAGNWGVFGFLRYLEDLSDPDNTSVDIGFKGCSSKTPGPFSWATECIYSGLLRSTKGRSRLRISLTVTYELQKNTLFSLTLGSDIAPLSTKSIASVVLSQGFGSERSVRKVGS